MRRLIAMVGIITGIVVVRGVVTSHRFSVAAMKGSLSAPPLQPMPIKALIALSDSFYASGAAAVGCSLVLVGSEWGTLVRLAPGPEVIQSVGGMPGHRQGVRLEAGGEDSTFYWSNTPPVWGVVRRDLTVRSLPGVMHPWGNIVSGAVFPKAGKVVMVPFSDVRVRHESPRPWVGAPLGYILTPEGMRYDSVSLVPDAGGAYLSWAKARSAAGVVGDTLVLLNLSNGELAGWTGPLSVPTWKTQLPRYYAAPRYQEETWSYPWIDIGGERVNLIAPLQVEMATVSPGGSVYAVRNYEVRWRAARVPGRFKIRGTWEPVLQGLEHYDTRGRVIGRYKLPDADVRWIRTGPDGHLFLGFRDRVVIAQIAGGDGECPTWPERIRVDVRDRPPDKGDKTLP